MVIMWGKVDGQLAAGVIDSMDDDELLICFLGFRSN